MTRPWQETFSGLVERLRGELDAMRAQTGYRLGVTVTLMPEQIEALREALAACRAVPREPTALEVSDEVFRAYAQGKNDGIAFSLLPVTREMVMEAKLAYQRESIRAPHEFGPDADTVIRKMLEVAIRAAPSVRASSPVPPEGRTAEDTARLDWLEAHPDNVWSNPMGGWAYLAPPSVITEAPNLRAAIDAARLPIAPIRK